MLINPHGKEKVINFGDQSYIVSITCTVNSRYRVIIKVVGGILLGRTGGEEGEGQSLAYLGVLTSYDFDNERDQHFTSLKCPRVYIIRRNTIRQ